MVRADFCAVALPGDRVTTVHSYAEAPTPPEVLRIHASLALGVASRCRRLLGRSAFDAELAACRAELDPVTIEAARGEAVELALRVAATLVAERGSRSLLLDDHAQRLAGEALFVLVYALRPGSRQTVLERLAR